MKTSQDPRHKLRQTVIQQLFAQSFTSQSHQVSKTKDVLSHTDKINGIIQKIAPEFPIEKINKVDLAILRLAIYELTVEKSTPPKVIVDEAIELAKEFGGESSPGFINGALGTLLKSIDNNEQTIDDRK